MNETPKFDQIHALEQKLLDPEIRASPDELDVLLRKILAVYSDDQDLSSAQVSAVRSDNLSFVVLLRENKNLIAS